MVENVSGERGASDVVAVRCPKCRGGSFELCERVEVDHVFTVRNGRALPMFVSQEFPIQIGFSARCDCGHRWVPRQSSANQIMDAETVAREATHD